MRRPFLRARVVARFEQNREGEQAQRSQTAAQSELRDLSPSCHAVPSSYLGWRPAVRKASFAGATKAKNTTGNARRRATLAPSVSHNAGLLVRTRKMNAIVAKIAAGSRMPPTLGGPHAT